MKSILIFIIILTANHAFAQSISYAYDNLGRLTKALYTDSSSIVYAYDVAGNRKTLSVSNPCINSPKPIITTSGVLTFCKGDSVILTSSFGLEYIWSNADTSQSIAVYKTGNYYVARRDNIGCLKNSDTVFVTANPAPDNHITSSGSTTFCQGKSDTLTASDSLDNYLWSTGATTRQITVNAASKYSVIVSNQFGCASKDSVFVIINPLPVVNAGADATILFGSSATLGSEPTALGNSPFTYNWQPVTKLNSATISNPTASPDNTTFYSVAVTDANGCKKADSVVIKVLPCDSLTSPIPTILSVGDSILICSTASYYQWYFNNNKLENENSKSLNIDKVGFYKVEASPNNVCWISSLDYPVVVTQNPLSDTLNMIVYPNPSNGNFNVYVKLSQQTGVETYVSIYDVNGTQLYQTNKLIFFGDEIRIPINKNFSAGTYIVKVFINGDSRQRTLIIQ